MEIPTMLSFDDLRDQKAGTRWLPDTLLRGIYAYGFETPSAIQQKTILPIVQGQDIIAQAQSGMGKTGAFCIGTLARIDFEAPGIQAVILSPTRELARQNQDVLTALGQWMCPEDNWVTLIAGGTNVRAERDAIRANRNLRAIVGTPGRILDHLSRGVFHLNDARLLVIDEADQMLSQGFEEAMLSIFRYFSKDIQLCLFSATFPDDIIRLAQPLLRPEHITVRIAPKEVTLEAIDQFYVEIDADPHQSWEQKRLASDATKLDALMEIYSRLTISAAIIFVNSQRKAEWLQKALTAEKHSVGIIHGGLSKEEREQIMEQFRSCTTRVLVSSDILARGIDCQSVDFVFNFDMPSRDAAAETYIHRIGRSGRYGRQGTAISFLNSWDRQDLQLVEYLRAHHGANLRPLPEDFEKQIGAQRSQA